ncbi:MAG: histidinol dehydrogenase [Ruminococcaceae bacterium]|nr:histidinol dehydrogenase [Oscillospiraceae bacterium]
MKIYRTELGEEKQLFALLDKRAESSSADITEKVRDVINNVRIGGDAALLDYCEKFDRCRPTSLVVSDEDINEAAAKAPEELWEIMREAADNIRIYHEKQLSEGYEFHSKGKKLGRIVRPLKRVGVYVPGGTAAYPSTVLMNCIPARVAGVEEIILVTPPKADGLNPVIAAAAKIAGVDKVISIGGAQAVAALAYGTESVPKVDKIVGPGNMFVAEAKRQVYGIVNIDMIAGPSEVCVVADATANADYIAADLLSQLEHDRAASAVLVTTDEGLANKVDKAIYEQLAKLNRCEIASVSLENWSACVIAKDIEDAFRVANVIAPEHLEIATENAEDNLSLVENAGSIFIGEYSPEPMGDYFAGTNHVLPTSGTARFSSPLSVDDFIKKMSYLSYSKDAFLRDADSVIKFAEVEGLDAHANSVRIRIEKK